MRSAAPMSKRFASKVLSWRRYVFCGNSVRGTSIGGKITVRGYGKICSENVVFEERFVERFMESPLHF